MLKNRDGFVVLLTRVPGVGEQKAAEGKTYRIQRVQHMQVDDDGRAEFGWHAIVDVELLPDDE